MRVAYGGEVLQVPAGWRLAAVSDDGRSVTLEREGSPELLALPAPGAPRRGRPDTKEALRGKILGRLSEAARPITSQRMCMEFLGVGAPERKVRFLKLLLQEMDAAGEIRMIPHGEGRPRTKYELPR